MAIEPAELSFLLREDSEPSPDIMTGEVIDIDADGRPLVDFCGNHLGPVPAQTLIQERLRRALRIRAPLRVLLVVPRTENAEPIVIGIIRSSVTGADTEDPVAVDRAQPIAIRVDGKRLVIEAREEIVLSCGKSSVTLKKDGKIIVKGTDLISRSSGLNRIKGASIKLN